MCNKFGKNFSPLSPGLSQNAHMFKIEGNRGVFYIMNIKFTLENQFVILNLRRSYPLFLEGGKTIENS